jgi:two-component system, chemotaxis family, CheB/CheR fusion protein
MDPAEKDPMEGAQSDEPQSTEEADGAGARRSHFPVVGIGASAGGLEAFTTLFRKLPPDLGVAYVVVPHLDPHRESAIAQIVGRVTSMPVRAIENGMPLQPDHVYVIPPNCDLAIRGGQFEIARRDSTRVVNATIDIFFRSLAADQGSNAIGIVLSGTASDGTMGLTAIKGEGGITFAQDTRSATYDGMPASAIAAGCVDFILPPEEIAKELARIRRHPYVAGSPSGVAGSEDKADDTLMAEVFGLLWRTTRVDFSEYKPPTIGRRIQRRMVLHKIERLAEYVSLLHRDRNEVKALYQDLLINVTSFFRNPEAYEALKQEAYPSILKGRPSSGTPIRIWVPGCSTGEEAYSHAIALMEFLGDERLEVPIQIFGTDLSEIAVQQARAAVYKGSIETDVSPSRLRRFFHKVDGGYQISKTIRDLCIFSTQNIFNDPPFSRMDLVSCRNVMIYLSQALQKRVIPVFHYALNPVGYLMIGSTEGLLGVGSELFEMADKKHKIYRKRLVATPVTFGFGVGPAEHERGLPEAPLPPPKPSDGPKMPLEALREADRLLLTRYTPPAVVVNDQLEMLLLTRYAPPAVVVNDQLEILQSRGRTGNFLELPPGKASLNLLKMARPGLLYEMQSAIEEAKRTGFESERRNVHVEGDGESHLTSVRVLPFRSPVQEQQQTYLVVFEPVSMQPPAAAVRHAEPLTEMQRSETEKQIAQLKQELSATKGYLQSIIEMQEATNEELQSANEEIQSGNEELQSTNEELETSKEELESANEELRTVNEEMQHRNDQLSQLNNDLTNLLNSVNLAMVMVGSDLSVRRFTPQATALMGLMPNDVGRPIPRLKLKIDMRNLEDTMLDVMQRVQPRHEQVQDEAGNWFTLRITPYRTLDHRIDGVVLTVVESDATDPEEGGRANHAKRASGKGRAAGAGKSKTPVKSMKKR